MKNPTPGSIAFFTSLLVCILVGLTLYFLGFISSIPVHGLLLVMISLLVFLFCYLFFYYALEIFIYRKIKLIYKSINNLKTSKADALSMVNLQTDILSEVNKEVVSWAQDKKEEIDQLKRSEIFRREFLGNVSHELKTPIFSIQGYIHTLLDNKLSDTSINIPYLEKAAHSIERLCRIVEDLEAISKLESGELALETSRFDIHEMCREVIDSLDMKSKERRISLGFKEGCDKAFFVEADKERIRQVVVNLLINSIKYGKEGGRTLIGFYDMDENLLIEISDNGIGIDSKHLPRLFERFYRVDKSRSRQAGGTGLGLSIVKHLIEAHHQTVNVRSTPGIGSTFGFTLKKSS